MNDNTEVTPSDMTATEKRPKWKQFVLFLLFECFLPVCPIFIEYFVYKVIGLSSFLLYEKSLVVSAMMLSMAAYLKASHWITKWSFGGLTFIGLVILTSVLIINADHVTVNPAIKESALNRCYLGSLIVGIIILGALIVIHVITDIIKPLKGKV